MENNVAMQGLWDLLDSERGIAFILTIVCATVLTAIGIITAEQWMDFAKYMAAVLIGSKTITTAIDLIKKPQQPQAAPSSAPAPSSQPPPAS